MWETTDGGQTWNFYDEGWGMGTPTDILINPYNPQEILVGGGPFVGVVKSIDGGENWFSVNDSITGQLNFNGGLVVSETDTNTIFAGAQGTVIYPGITGGPYVSRNGGSTWEIYNYCLPDSALDFISLKLFLDQTNTLFMSVSLLFGNAKSEEQVYRLRNAVITNIESIIDSESKIQLSLRNYPNPFNSTTLLHYSIPKTGRVTIKIYTVLGKEVLSLLDKIMNPGEYKINWDGTNHIGKKLSSGIYLATIQTGTELSSSKLLILK
jgi:type IX secretion system substrate protein